MRKVYICSPYRAKDGAELDRNIDYAQQLTRQALEAGLAPITPHLYMTQCMDDKKPEERARGMAAGLALLKGCDFVIAGVKYGITEGMDREIHTANTLGIAVIDASQIKAYMRYEEKRQERAASDYAKLHECKHCYEGHNRVKVFPLDDSGNYAELASYLIKYTGTHKKGTDGALQGKRWNCSKNLVRPEPEYHIISDREYFKKEPKAIKGYYVDKNSVSMGVHSPEYYGYGYLRYTLVKITDRGG